MRINWPVGKQVAGILTKLWEGMAPWVIERYNVKKKRKRKKERLHNMWSRCQEDTKETVKCLKKGKK